MRPVAIALLQQMDPGMAVPLIRIGEMRCTKCHPQRYPAANIGWMAVSILDWPSIPYVEFRAKFLQNRSRR